MSSLRKGIDRSISKRLLIYTMSDKFFLSHFLDRALHALQHGFKVIVVTPDTGHAARIIDCEFEFIEIKLERHGINPFFELKTIFELVKIYRRIKPDIIWQIGVKPIVLGTLARNFTLRNSPVINAPVGLGYVFAGQGLKAQLVRPILKIALSFLLNPKNSKVIFENTEDFREMQALLAVNFEDGVVIPGAGVDLTQYPLMPEPMSNVPVVFMAARMIEEKGVWVFVEAARILRQRGRSVHFRLAGGIDHQHSAAIPEADLRQWHKQGVVEWLGECSDIAKLMASCNIFCLPTWHREGLPKVLLEAMAAQRAIITTDVVGCREVIQHKENGYLIKPRDAVRLADAIEFFIDHPELRKTLAAQARADVEEKYSSEIVVERTMTVINSLLAQQ